MGSPKHLLRHNNRPLYLHTLELLQTFCHSHGQVHVSVRSEDQARSFNLPESWQHRATFLYDAHAHSSSSHDMSAEMKLEEKDIGPAAGLLAAYHDNPSTHWLVIACDYPLLTHDALRQLLNTYEEPVTCFVNQHGWSEPLIGIWSPVALQKLENNVRQGNKGPGRAIKELHGRLVKPEVEWWIKGVNTADEWTDVLRLLQDGEFPQEVT